MGERSRAGCSVPNELRNRLGCLRIYGNLGYTNVSTHTHSLTQAYDCRIEAEKEKHTAQNAKKRRKYTER